jgi:hypothetical protein
MRNPILAATVLLLAGCGGPLFTAELVVPEFGITLPQQAFPAMTADPSHWCSADRPDCISTDLAYDVGEQVGLLTEQDTEYELRLSDLAITLDATNAATDLSGVKSAVIEAFPPGASAPVEVASYARSTTDARPTSIAISGKTGVDLAPFVDAGQIHVRVKMNFDAPTPDFTADVLAVFYLRVKLDYGKSLGL